MVVSFLHFIDVTDGCVASLKWTCGCFFFFIFRRAVRVCGVQKTESQSGVLECCFFCTQDKDIYDFTLG